MQTTISGALVTSDGKTVSWTSGMEVDVDGAPNAYAPAGLGYITLDDLRNAGTPGDYYGLACDSNGKPYVQGPNDPYPGYFVSQNAVVNGSYPPSDPRRYMDASKVKYLAVPKQLIALGVRKGDLLIASVGTMRAGAIVGDGEPSNHIGEGSFALHMALGYDPRRALPHHYLVGIDHGVHFTIFLGTAISPPWPRPTLDADLTALLSSH